MQKDATCHLYNLFADLLSYPTLNLTRQAETCLAQLRPVHSDPNHRGFPEAAAALEKFSEALSNRTLAQNEELYTVTFDMQPVCYPYVGFQLFGESYKRGAFMAQLNEAYHAFGYSAGDELPDHVPAILHFLGLDSVNRQGDFCQALLNEGLLPALGKMRQAFGEQSENPYASLLTALQLLLTPTLNAKSPRRQIAEIL